MHLHLCLVRECLGMLLTMWDAVACSTPLGMYLSGFEHRNRFKDILQNWPSKAVQIVVVSTCCRCHCQFAVQGQMRVCRVPVLMCPHNDSKSCCVS